MAFIIGFTFRDWFWSLIPSPGQKVPSYFETDQTVDAKRVGLEGHSRYGKATIVAMGYNPRFAIAYVSSSGEGGAAPRNARLLNSS
ncbi:MAG: glucuronyl esterase domain-containing protein [Limisphaerales bacterium]